MTTRQVLAAAAVALLLVTAGCAGLGGNADDAGDEDVEPVGDGDSAAGSDAGARAGGAAFDDPEVDRQLQRVDRQLIRTGELTLEVEDAAAASAVVREVTDRHGGFVSDSRRRVHEVDNETWQTEVLVVRVPSDAFEDAFGDLEDLGEVQHAETSTEDVTDQLVDLEARLANLEVQRDRLRTLYEEANETEDVLAVQRELSDVQEEIERLEAQKQRLERDVAYSTITVRLAEPKPEPEVAAVPSWYETPVEAAFAESIDAVRVTLRAIVVAGAYAAPFALVFGTPLVGAAAVYRYRSG